MLHGYFREAAFLLEEGASPQQVDRVIRDFGFAMGPFATSDLAGLDVGWRIRKGKHAIAPPVGRYSRVADQLCELGRFGQKTGAGYYRYEAGDRTPHPDPLVDEIIERNAREDGIVRRAVSDEEILKRCLYPLVNEAGKILDEGIATRPGDVDVVWVYGYGFPAFRGGPLRWADSVGLATIVDEMRGFAKEHGEAWEPATLLVRLAESGGTFGALRAEKATANA
jgi:3-hydroxyacyl-CoA dehydrogenase